MRVFRLPYSGEFQQLKNVVVSREHCLFTEQVDASYAMPEHHAGFGIVHSLSGDSSCCLNGLGNTVSDNSFLLINRNSRVSMKVQKANTQPVLLYFQSDVPDQVAASLYHSTQTLLDEPTLQHEINLSLLERLHPASPSIKSRLSLLAALPDSCSSFHALKADAVIRSLLEEIMMANHRATQEAVRLNVVKQSTRIELYKRLHMAREWMEAHFDEPVTLQKVATVAHLNSQHFLRMFNQLFHQTPHQYLIHLRLEAAKQLIANTDLTITEICTRVGWESLASFSKLFRDVVGVTPTGFRR